jgi:hypothetical protein
VKIIYNPAIFELDIGAEWPELFNISDKSVNITVY